MGYRCVWTFIVLGTILGTGRLGAQEVPSASDATRAKQASTLLLKHYNKSTGLFDTTGWWNSANGMTALADEASWLGKSEEAESTFDNTFLQAQTKFPGFLNEYLDDEGWWALAWIAVYDLDHRPERLQMAASIFADMTAAWDTTCGGGIWWKKDHHYKNAIANELFLSVAAKLAQRSTGERKKQYMKWAEDEWTWFQGSGMINARHLVNDGLDAACKNNGKTEWSYNQGVLLSGLADLSDLRGNSGLRETAGQIAHAAIATLSAPDRILHDVCEPQCGEDGVQFKGIFVRNLAYLYAGKPPKDVRAFLERNADSLWLHGRAGEGDFGIVWSGPSADAGAAGDIVALDLFVASGAGNTAGKH